MDVRKPEFRQWRSDKNSSLLWIKDDLGKGHDDTSLRDHGWVGTSIKRSAVYFSLFSAKLLMETGVLYISLSE